MMMKQVCRQIVRHEAFTDCPAAPVPKPASVEAEEELPEIDETTVDSFSQEVGGHGL